LDRVVHPLADVRPEAVVLHRIALPLRSPFVTAHGVETAKQATVVEVIVDGTSGWAECSALAAPDYTSEWADGAYEVLDRFLAPAWCRSGPAGAGWVVGHHMARAAVELAAVDAVLRVQGRSLADAIGATRRRVPSGVVIGIADADTTVRTVEARLEEGYRRLKCKLDASTDLAVLAEIRRRHPDVELAADANGSLVEWANDDPRFDELDDLALRYLEQPLGPWDLDGHARLAARLRTPLCLDEPLASLADVQRAVTSGACRVVNLKPSRVGGLGEAVRIHDWCREHHVDLWMGGMLETGVGRASCIAIAALDGFTLTGDLSATSRWFDTDVTAPFELDADGMLAVPTGPGIGVHVDLDVLARVTTRRSIHEGAG
jgi:O-succinylbenzoate synthase